jgi:hypothetical protein
MHDKRSINNRRTPPLSLSSLTFLFLNTISDHKVKAAGTAPKELSP